MNETYSRDPVQQAPAPQSHAFLSGILLALVALASPSAHANLVTDPGFELGGAGWTFQGLGAGVTGAPHTGAIAGYINVSSTNPSISQLIPTVAGQSYLVEFWLAQNLIANPGTLSVQVSFGSTVGFATTDPLSIPALYEGSPRGYGYYSFIAQANAPNQLFELTGNTSYTVLLDDVSVTAVDIVPLPAAAWLLLSGLGGLGFLGRRRKAA